MPELRWMLLIGASVVSVGCSSAGPSGASLGVRNGHAMIYDENRAAVVVFGGADEERVHDDAWSWDGRSWSELPAAAGPRARTFPTFIWDSIRKQAVLYGGRRVLFGAAKDSATCLDDTWILDQNGWSVRTVTVPPPRCEAGFAFDTKRGVGVLFGGYDDSNGSISRRGDTWEWNGREWRLRAQTGPAPRSGMAMAYDPSIGRVVLFGGNGGPRSDTWLWDGERWEEATTPPVPGRFNAVAQYDSAKEVLVRATGWDGRSRVTETWLFRGKAWIQVARDGPPARNHAAMAFDRRRGRLVLFGGHDGTNVFGDTWEWDGANWSKSAEIPARRRVDNGH